MLATQHLNEEASLLNIGDHVLTYSKSLKPELSVNIAEYRYTGWADNNVPNVLSVLQLNDITENCEIWILRSRDTLLLIFKFGQKSSH